MQSRLSLFSSKTTFAPETIVNYTKDILDNLKALGISEVATQRILVAVQKMPGLDHVQGALKFLTELTARKSIREQYFQYSEHIAEYFCTISNLGLFAVAFYYNDYATLIAATFSALSHAIPSQRLHDLDMLGLFVIFGKAIANYKLFMVRPDVAIYGLGAFSINVLDTFVTRHYLDLIGPVIHVAWHLAAALALYKFNQAQTEVTAEELQSISLTRTLKVPGFLQDTYAKIGEYFHPFSALKNGISTTAAKASFKAPTMNLKGRTFIDGHTRIVSEEKHEHQHRNQYHHRKKRR